MSASEPSPDDDGEAAGGAPERDVAPTKAEIEEAIRALEGEVVDESPSGPDLSNTRAVQMFSHSGPLPSAEWFEGMERIEPGVTREIVGDYLEERKHHRSLEKDALGLDKKNLTYFSRYQTLQLAAAWSIAVMFGAAGIVLIATGHQITGLIWLVVEISVLVGVFLGREHLARRQPPLDNPPVPSEIEPPASS